MFRNSLPSSQLLTVACLITLDVIKFVFVLDVVCCNVYWELTTGLVHWTNLSVTHFGWTTQQLPS